MKMQRSWKKVVMAGLGVAMAGSLIGTTLVANAQNSGGPAQTPSGNAQGQQRSGHPGRGHRPHIDFKNRLGGQWQYKDADGKVHTVASIPGTVVSVSGNKVTITPNDGSANKEFTFDTTDKERLAAHIASLKAGDKVVVTTLDGVAQGIHKAPQKPSEDEIKERMDKAKERAEEMRKKMQERRENRGSGGTTTGTNA